MKEIAEPLAWAIIITSMCWGCVQCDRHLVNRQLQERYMELREKGIQLEKPTP